MSSAEKTIYEQLVVVQQTAHAPREVPGRFGKARSAEQILAEYKTVCNENGLFLYTTDDIEETTNRTYVKATAVVVLASDPKQRVEAVAYAWENDVSGGLDTSQVTGKTSSYAKKYALQNLFAIDDTKDSDFDEPPAPKPTRAPAPAPVVSTEPPKPVTLKQRQLISKLFGDLGVEDNDVRLDKVEKVLGHRPETIGKISSDEANTVIKWLTLQAEKAEES